MAIYASTTEAPIGAPGIFTTAYLDETPGTLPDTPETVNKSSPSLGADWAKAMRALLDAWAKQAMFYEFFWQRAFCQERNGGPPIPEDVGAEMDRLVSARNEAENTLIAMPAPGLTEVIWKIEYARQSYMECAGWPDGYYEAVLADLTRIEGGAA